MPLDFSRIVLGAPLLLSVALVACNSDRAEVAPSDTSAANSAPPAAASKEIAITSETPVEVTWRYCDTSLFPEPTEFDPYPVDKNGCRINRSKIQVGPLDDGTVEIHFVRNRKSPSTMGLGEAEVYAVATRSRGCDPDGPQEEEFYRSGEGVNVFVEAADDRKFMQLPEEDVSLTALEAPDDEGEVIEGFLFLGAGSCRQIDPDRVF